MLKRCFVNIRQRPFRCMLLLLLFTFLITFVVFSILTYNAATVLRNDTYKQIGVSLSVAGNKTYKNSLKETQKKQGNLYNENDYYPPLSSESLNAIHKIDGVLGIEAMNSNSLLDALPVNFENSHLYTGVNPYTQISKSGLADNVVELYSNAVSIIGCSSVEQFEYFRRNLSYICEGTYPSKENPGVIISTIIAEENNLQVGDMLDMKVITKEYGEGETVTLSDHINSVKVVGIFTTNLYFDVCETNNDGIEIFKSSPYNNIFADFDTAVSLNGKTNDIRFFQIYVDSPEKIDAVLTEIRSVPIDWEKYEVFNTAIYYDDMVAQTEKFLTSTLIIVLASIIAGAAMFFIIIQSFDDNRDISVLLLLGEKKNRIVKGKLIEYAVIAMLSLPISVVLGYQVARYMQTALTPTMTFAGSLIYSFTIGADNYIPDLRVTLTPLTIIYALLYMFFLMLIILGVTTYRTYGLKKKGFAKPD